MKKSILTSPSTSGRRKMIITRAAERVLRMSTTRRLDMSERRLYPQNGSTST
jgi:hypothetical protein